MRTNKNITRYVLISLLCCSTPWSFGAQEQGVAIFRKAQPDASLKPENAWVLPRLVAERDIAEKFSLKAQVTLPTQKATNVFEKGVFDPAPPSPNAADGWRSLGNGWLIGQRGAKPFATRWTANLDDTLDLNAWDELWYEYSTAPQTTLCAPGIALTAKSWQGKDKAAKQVRAVAKGNVGTPQVPLHNLPLGKRRVVEKDYLYLASRSAHLEPDEVWRWAREQKSLVVQRRMHFDLKNAEALEIAMRPGIQVERVNLLVSSRDNQSPGELIEFPAPPMQLDSTSGLPMLRLNMLEALKQRFPDRFPPDDQDAAALKNWFVQEVFIFISNPPAQGFEQAPVESLRTLGASEQAAMGQAKQGTERILLPSRMDSLGAGRARMVVDLKGLRKFQSLNLATIETRLAVPNDAEGCAIAPGKLYRVSTGQTSVPNYVLHGAQGWSKRLGGAYLFPGRENGRFESVEMQAYLPFSNRISSLSEADAGTERKSSANTELARKEELDGGREEELGLAWNSFAGEGVDGSPGSQFTQENDALLLEGRDRQISVKWPARTRLEDNSHLFVSLLKDSDQVRYIEAVLELVNGQMIRRSLQPNTGLKLGAGGNEVRRVTLTFHLVKSPFRIRLREVAIFVPKIMDEREAFLSRFPMPTVFSPRPLNLAGAIATDAAEGRISALMPSDGDGAASFKTSLDRPLDGVKGIRLGFAVPDDWVGPACPLSIELVGSRASLVRALCFDKTAGDTYLPLAQWLAATKGGSDIGALREIRWEVRRPSGGKVDAFSFNWNIEGWRMLNQRELIEDAVLLKVGGKPFGIGELTEREREAISDGRRKFWLPLQPDALGALLKNMEDAEWGRDESFQVEQIVLAPKTPMAWDKWLQLIAAPVAEPNNGRWMKLGFVALSVGILVGLGRKGILTKFWRALSKFSGTTILRLRVLGNWFVGLVWQTRRLVNWMVVALVLVMLLPGIYWAGTRGFTLEAFFIGFAMLNLGLGALLHARPLPKWMAGIENALEGIQPALRLSSFIAILLAIWAVGALKTVSGAAYAFLPLAATAYWQSPRLVSCWMAYARRCHHGSRFLLFLAITLALYAIGLFRNIAGGENYFFTFGGMVAVIALRYAILSLQPAMTRHWPSASENIYRGGGALYFSGALAMLVVTALLLALKLEPLAEQAAIVVYYCLVVGTVIEIAALRREKAMSAPTGVADQQDSP